MAPGLTGDMPAASVSCRNGAFRLFMVCVGERSEFVIEFPGGQGPCRLARFFPLRQFHSER